MKITDIIAQKKGMFQNFSLYLLASIIPSCLTLIANPFYAKNLSSLDYSILGFYSSFNSLFLPIMNFSLISFYVRKYYKIEETERRIVCDSIIVGLIFWGVLSSILVLLLFFFYCSYKNISIPFTPYAFLCVGYLFFNNFLLVYQANCRMRRKAREYFNVMMSSSLITITLSMLLVVFLKFGASGKMSAQLLCSVIISIICIWKSLSYFRVDIRVLKEAFSFGWPISTTSILQYFMVGIDMVLLSKLNNISAMGLYSVGISIGAYISIFFTALTQTFEPDIYKAVAEYDYLKILKIVGLVASILLGISLLFISFARPITFILTYGRYTDAYCFAQIISLSIVSMYFMSATKMILNAFGFTKACLFNQVISAVLSLILFNYMICSWEYYGAAWSKVISPLFVFVVGLVQLYVLYPRIKKEELNEKNK